MDLKSLPSRLVKGIKNLPSTLKKAIINYQESYRNGVEKFGVWWKVFQISMWAFILVFVFTAVIILVVYLPRAELLQL